MEEVRRVMRPEVMLNIRQQSGRFIARGLNNVTIETGERLLHEGMPRVVIAGVGRLLQKNVLDSGVFCFLTLVHTESVARRGHNQPVSLPPGRPSPTGCACVHSDVDAPHRPENASVPRMEHGSSAIVKTLRPERPPRTTFRSLRKTAPESRTSREPELMAGELQEAIRRIPHVRQDMNREPACARLL